MVWFKCDDRLPSSRKAAKAGVAAMGLWVLAGCWSAGEELDGFVPAYMVTRLAGADGDALASSLVSAGFWLEDQHEGEDGYRFHQWGEYQPTRAQLEVKREQARERMNRVRANRERTSPEVTPTPTRPDPTKEKAPSRKRSDSEKAGDDFAAFWSIYPKRQGKEAAARAWLKAVRIADPSEITEGARAAAALWKAENREAQFIPQPATWLNGGRWQDETQTQIPVGQAARRATLMQCADPEPHPRHQWDDGPNLCHCQGVEA